MERKEKVRQVWPPHASLVAIMPAKIGTPTRLPSWTIELKAINKYAELWINYPGRNNFQYDDLNNARNDEIGFSCLVLNPLLSKHSLIKWSDTELTGVWGGFIKCLQG